MDGMGRRLRFLCVGTLSPFRSFFLYTLNPGGFSLGAKSKILLFFMEGKRGVGFYTAFENKERVMRCHDSSKNEVLY